MKYIITAIIAILIGLGAGYFIFGKNQNTEMTTSNPSQESAHDHGQNSAEEEVWTCSMHPQIRQNEPGDCALCGMDLIPLEAGTSNDPLVLEMTEAAVALANIQTTTVGSALGSSENTIRLSGKVQADERLASSQVAHVPGRIEKLFVTFTGEQVSAGQQLATLYSPDLISAQQELLEAQKLISVNPNLLEAARNKLRFWKISEATISSIEQSGKVQETFPLFAQASGIVTNRRVSVGDYVRQGEPLFELMSLRKVWVLFDAYESDLAQIKVGSRVEFTTPAVSNKTFTTRITFIDPVMNAATRTTSLRAEVNNSNGLLKPEMFVTGYLQNKKNASAQLSVPKSAVMWTGTRSVVYVKLPDTDIPSYQFREVEIGESLGGNYQVVNGLEAGEEVVTYGSFTIDAAAQLNNQASMMNRNVQIKSEVENLQIPDYRESTPKEFKEQLGKVVAQYILLKNALVETDAEKARLMAAGILEILPSVNMALVKGEAHLYWMEQLQGIRAHTTKITESDDVEKQRKQFDFLSQALIHAVEAFGVSEQTFYVQFCPMVDGNRGADWLSERAEIENPYFGDKMMTCGLVKATINEDGKILPVE